MLETLAFGISEIIYSLICVGKLSLSTRIWTPDFTVVFQSLVMSLWAFKLHVGFARLFRPQNQYHSGPREVKMTQSRQVALQGPSSLTPFTWSLSSLSLGRLTSAGSELFFWRDDIRRIRLSLTTASSEAPMPPSSPNEIPRLQKTIRHFGWQWFHLLTIIICIYQEIARIVLLHLLRFWI